MKIKNLKVKNYRRFVDAELNLAENQITILAGANNSGKTSLVRLLRAVFEEQNNIHYSDCSINMKGKLHQELFQILESKFISNDKEELDELTNFKSKLEHFFNECLEKYLIQVKVTISYELDEDISLFADYLMDLDEANQEFYFLFQQKYISKRYTSLNDSLFEQLFEFFKKRTLDGYDLKLNKLVDRVISELIDNQYFYTDNSFKITNKIQFSEFSNLFNFKLISANRELDDDEVKSRKISDEIIESTNPLSEGKNWQNLYEDTYNSIEKTLDESDISSKLSELTSSSLKQVITDIKEVNETEIDALETSLEFERSSFIKLLKESMSSKYVYMNSGKSNLLGEETQGLGISNLIYLTLSVTRYKRTLASSKVNLFIIEEPEVHLHVQMEKILIDFLSDLFQEENKGDGNIQGFITTHSNEIISNVLPETIKVIRPIKFLENKIFDMEIFLKNEVNVEIKDFINIFFKLNFTNLVFSDKAILYEGDTEKLFIESIIQRGSDEELFRNLSRQYISYCQVGGAYAQKYFSLLEFLQVKTCVFTDIDYCKTRSTQNNLCNDKTTNETLKNVVRSFKLNNNLVVKVKHILEWQKETKNSLIGYKTKVFTQTGADGYARTLEDAILFKILKEDENFVGIRNVFTKLEKTEWENFIEESRLQLTVPQSTNGATIRDKAKSIEKTDFMYSLITEYKPSDCVPDYIQRGLTWLNQD